VICQTDVFDYFLGMRKRTNPTGFVSFFVLGCGSNFDSGHGEPRGSDSSVFHVHRLSGVCRACSEGIGFWTGFLLFVLVLLDC
jgi:hypothetical protein